MKEYYLIKKEEKKDFDYFILLFYNFYKNKKYIYKLFSLYDNEILQQKNNNELFKLKDYIEEIYNNKQKVFKLLQEEKEEKAEQIICKENEKNIFYFCIIYFFISINENLKIIEILNELSKR